MEDEEILNSYGGNPCINNDGGILTGSDKSGFIRCNKCGEYFYKEQLNTYWKLMACGAN